MNEGVVVRLCNGAVCRVATVPASLPNQAEGAPGLAFETGDGSCQATGTNISVRSLSSGVVLGSLT